MPTFGRNDVSLPVNPFTTLEKQKTILEKCWRRVSPCTDFWNNINNYWGKGYLRPPVAVVLVGIGWAFLFIFAIILSAYCVITSVVLFCYGIIDIVTYWWRKYVDRSTAPTYSETAMNMVYRLNDHINEGSKHFGVERMLKMTTGLDVEDIWLRTQWSKFMQARTTGDSEFLKLALRHVVSRLEKCSGIEAKIASLRNIWFRRVHGVCTHHLGCKRR